MTRRRIISLAIIAVTALALIAVSIFFWDDLRGILPLIRQPSADIAEVLSAEEVSSGGSRDETDNSLIKLRPGFEISILSGQVPAARVLALGPEGGLWVSQTGIGKVTRIGLEDGKYTGQDTVFEGLDDPHGLAFDPREPDMLYIAQEKSISRVMIGENGEPSGSLEKIIDLPAGGRHYTRTIGFGGDGRLYVSIGSTCDVCDEEDDRHAAIYSLKRDGTDFQRFASGLRNAVFFRVHPVTGEIWATEMGRDNLGDDLPPDEINIVLEGRDYGWPYCYGQNVQDTDFDSSEEASSICSDAEPSYIDLQAHSAPLGLDFIPPGPGWPDEYAFDLLVAYHGSWNRSIPTGYKIVRFLLDDEGDYLGREDFAWGWLTEDGSVLGRPVDILILPEGTAYISDDRAGVIYRLGYSR